MSQQLKTNHDHVLGYQLSGTITEDEAKEILAQLSSVIDREQTVCLLVRLPEEPEHAQLAALNQNLRFFRDHADRIERYALVTNRTSYKWAARAADVLTPMDVRPYPLEEEEEAWRWLESGDDSPLRGRPQRASERRP